MNDIFKQKDNSQYNLRQISEFSRPLVNSVYHGSKIVLFLVPKLKDNLNTFKNKIKKCKPANCPCRLCKIYINNIGLRAKEKLGIFSSIRRSISIACQYCFVTSTSIFFNLFNLLFLACL